MKKNSNTTPYVRLLKQALFFSILLLLKSSSFAIGHGGGGHGCGHASGHSCGHATAHAFSHSAGHTHYYSCFYPGYILLKNKDSLYGQILMDPGDYNLKKYKDTGNYIILKKEDSSACTISETKINCPDIYFIRLNYHIVYSKGVACSENYSQLKHIRKKNLIDSIAERHTDFKKFTCNGKERLLRLIVSDKVDLYDLYPNPEKDINETSAVTGYLTPIYTGVINGAVLFIGENNQIAGIPGQSRPTFNFNRNKFLVKYINSRYKTDFHLRHFHSNMEMVHYIAEHG